ncbi:hypothetical protein BB560_003623 [Smittium megazygosporum]|uniref:Ketoreductase domain-containing protein n=1 Tax=Smittium megazygosporum TaxID=133381 RepID=A0A2T9ZBE9_9FUNG|nr:hypothetical protein BB560_003623 [Smittium megazygosporum]
MSQEQLRFDGRVVIVTGAGGGLGRAYALLYAARGASVVVNDLGVGPLGIKGSSSAADKVVEEIRKNGGKAIANYDSVENGDRIVDQAVKTFGRIDIVINNAGNLRDRTFLKLTESEWQSVLNVHLKGSYKVARAAWPFMKKQRYGRIINTSSTSGVYGNFGQSNYGTAKFGLVGLSNALATEGAKFNITVNTLVPTAASNMTATSMAKEIMNIYDPKYVAPIVLNLTHDSNTYSGRVFEAAGGYFASSRWQVAKGCLFKPDYTFTPSAVKARWNDITDFSQSTYPTIGSTVDYPSIIREASSLKDSNPQSGEELRFDNKVVVITGSGSGLGRDYALYFAEHGAKVVVNDISVNSNGIRSVDTVVSEIRSKGGIAVPNYDSAVNGDRVVDTAISKFGRIDILINNAGTLSPTPFENVTDEQWEEDYKIHVFGPFKATHAAWPHFVKQKSGVIINTSSAPAIYGHPSIATYSAAKAALLGFTNVLALEGAKNNIRINTIAPIAGTPLMNHFTTSDIAKTLKLSYVTPVVAFLAHDSCSETGKYFHIKGPWCAQIRRQRSGGVIFPQNDDLTPEVVRNVLHKITDFDDGHANFYATNRENASTIIERIIKINGFKLDAPASNSKRPAKVVDVVAARNHKFPPSEFVYTPRDSMLYALGIGASAKDLHLVYELSPKFQVFPTFAVMPAFFVDARANQFLPEYHPMMLLHGEQYIEIKDKFPTSGTLVCTPSITDIVDKTKGATVTMRITMVDKRTNKVVAISESTSFIRGIGGFSKAPGYKQPPSINRPKLATAAPKMPSALPDRIISQAIGKDQAALYRLSGDYNPLHIDPEMAAKGNFKQPILHGLCSMGHAARHVINGMANGDPSALKAMKVRFSSPVYPGETIETRMWIDKSDPKTVLFEARIPERNVVVISNAVAVLDRPASSSVYEKHKL